MTRLRVVHVIQNLNYGGMERVLADLVRLADTDAFEPHVLPLQYAGRFAAELGPHAVLHAPPRQEPWSMLWPRALARQLGAIAPHVVHTHSGVWYKVSLAARQAGVPRVIHTAHGRPTNDNWFGHMLERRAAHRTDVIVAVSDALAAELRASVARNGAVRVIPNGVDIRAHRPAADAGPLPRELGLPEGTAILGSVGRLEPIKGYEVMVEALALLRERWGGDTPPVLVLAGDGSHRPALEALAARRQVASHVRFLGWRDDVPVLHSAFTLFSMSSHSEGMSVSLLEAMSAGLCPVVTDVGGNRAVLGPALAHRLVRPADPHALAAEWERALADGAARAADGRAARQRVEREFSVEAMVRRYEALYRESSSATTS